MKIELTNEEKEAIELYLSEEFQVINQLLVSDSNSDVSLLREDVENKKININYERGTLVRDLKAIKVIYELLQKANLKRLPKSDWAFSRGTNIAEVERFKNESYIDKFLVATENKDDAENKFASIWNEPAVMYIRGDSSIPYIDFQELEGIDDLPKDQTILISPFTQIKTITNSGDIKINNKIAKTFNILLEKQELQGMPKEDKENLYINILGNSDFINLKLGEVVRLEKESNNIYENIRKLEQLVAKYEQELDKKKNLQNYSDYEIKIDEENIERTKNEVNFLKNEVSETYTKIKQCTEYITNWKKNVTIYIMSECYDIDVKYQELYETAKNQDNSYEIDENPSAEENTEPEVDNNIDIEPSVTNVEEVPVENIVEPAIKEKVFEPTISDEEDVELGKKAQEVTRSCMENSEEINKLSLNIGYLLQKQQSNAKIAGTVGARYSALNNCFEMKKQAQLLKELNDKIYEKIQYLYNFEKGIADKKLDKIGEINFQISTLINYLNNPKSSVGKTRINRFEEMAIIEENELKRNIADLLQEIRGEAELKKLKDDLEIIEDKNPIQKILGIFTGRNKLDEAMINQIIIREDAIKRSLSKEFRLDYNYSIHELIAETEMFIRENEDDDLVEDDVKRLRIIEDELKQYFVVLEEKVKDIINEREGRNLPIDDKITREELAEIETRRFLKKYKYDQKETQKDEVSYQDTTANEISTIIEYIKTSNIL